MKRVFLVAIIFMAIAVSSCSVNEMVPESTIDMDTFHIPQCVTRSTSSDESILNFDSEDEFQATVDYIQSLYSNEEKIAWVMQKFPQFESLQNLYWEAMTEIDEIEDDEEDSEESFAQFQQKYDGLYFPKYMEDAGFYIPMKDLNAAFLVNRFCEVSIGGEVKNLRDIEDYGTLAELGRAYYSIETPMPISDLTSFTLRSTSMDPVGPEYDSGWTTYTNTSDGTERKVKLKVRRKFETIQLTTVSSGSESRLHLELCFRKNRWFGWVNYKGSAEMIFTAQIPGYGSTFGPLTFENDSYSSHDEEFPYPVRITRDDSYWYHTFAETPFTVTVNFNKINQPIVYSFNMYGIQSKTPVSATPLVVMPYF